MKGFFKKTMVLFLVGVLLLGSSILTGANYKPNDCCSPTYVIIANRAASLSISGITASCSASLSTIMSCSISITMELQKQKQSGYETIKTWSSSRTGTSLSMTESRVINVLETYRLKVTFTAGNEINTVYKY